MKKIFGLFLPAACCLLLVAIFTSSAAAQQTLGSLNGTVSDVSGASVSGATVTVVGEQTGLTRSTTTGSNGYWEILNLPIGSYKISISAANFESENFPGIVVQEMRATTIPSSLKPGKVTESVTVTAN